MAMIYRLSSSILLRGSSSSWQSVKSSPSVLSCYYRTTAPQCEKSATTPLVPGEDFWKKNERLNRPTSPHLTIYKPQLTSLLSVSHRGTGIFLSAVLSGFGIGMMCLPASFPYYAAMLANSHYGFAAIFAAKFAIVFPFNFHMFNGIRHLVWDMGYGFSLRALYKSGYSVVAVSLISSLLLAYM